MKITIIKRAGEATHEVIVNEPLLELSDFNTKNGFSFSELSGAELSIAQLKEKYEKNDPITTSVPTKANLFNTSDYQLPVLLDGCKAFSLILEEILNTLPDDTLLRFN